MINGKWTRSKTFRTPDFGTGAMVSHDNKDIELEKRGDVLPTTTTNSRGESRGETLPGWTIMRPLRMRGLKGKKNGSGESSLVRSAGGFAEDGDRDVKGSETTEGSGIGEVEGLGDLRSDDELLSGEEEEDLGRVNGIVGVDGEVAGENRVYKVYKRRWFGLVQLVLLNIVVSWDVSVVPLARDWISLIDDSGFLGLRIRRQRRSTTISLPRCSIGWPQLLCLHS